MKLSIIVLAATLPACGLVQIKGPDSSSGVTTTSETTSSGGHGPSAATRAWRRAQAKHEDALESLHYYATTKTVASHGTVNQFADNALALLQKDAFAELKDQCRKHVFAGEKDGTAYGKEYMHAKVLCPEIARSEEILKDAVRLGARAFAEYQVSDGFERELAKIEKEQRVYVDLVVQGNDAEAEKKRVASFVQKYYDALGEPLPDDVLGRIDTQVQTRSKAIQDAAAKGKIAAPASRDAAAERAIIDAYKSHHPQIRIVRAWMTDPGWRTIREDGIISRRAKNAELLVKAKDGTYCAVIPASVGQPYAGGGQYSSTIGVDEFIEGTPVRCP